MADEELLKGEEEKNIPQAEEDNVESADNASPDEAEAAEAKVSDEMTEAEVSDEPAEADEESADVVMDDSEDESMDDLVEKQMLEELERLENEGDEGAVSDSVDDLAAMSDDVGIDDTDEVVEAKDIRQPDFPSFEQTKTTDSEKNLELLMDVNLPIAIELGRTTLKIKDILSLGPGSVVELKKLAGEPVDLLVNNKIVAKGEVVVVDENFGLRITSLLSPEERLRTLE